MRRSDWRARKSSTRRRSPAISCFCIGSAAAPGLLRWTCGRSANPGEPMAKTLEFLFDFGSPNCWLAYRALPPLLARTGARLEIAPVLLGGIFKATGNQSPITAFAAVKGKLAYDNLETRRFIDRHELTRFRMNPHFPVNTLLLMRGLVAARVSGQGEAYLEAGLQGLWEEGL